MNLSRRDLLSASALLLAGPGATLRAAGRQSAPAGPLVLCWNENPYGPSPAARAAVSRSIPEACRYPDDEVASLTAALAAREGVSAEHIVTGTGSGELLRALGLIYGRDGGEIIAAQPTYDELAHYAQVWSAAIRFVPLNAQLRHDLPAMHAAVSPHTRAVYLCNPNNPTGTAVAAAQIREFVGSLPPTVTTIVDEAYMDFAATGATGSVVDLVSGGQPVVVLRTFSKIFGLAGLRVGYSVAREDITRLLNNVRQPFNITSLGLVAVEAGMDDREHVRRTLEVNASGMDYLEREFRRLGLPFLPSQANFILVEVGEGRAVYEKLLAEGVIVRPMNGYGLPRHVRVSVGLEEENHRMVAALERVLKAGKPR